MKSGMEGASMQKFINPIASTILKWFKFQIFSPAQQWFWIGNQGMYFTKGSEIILN
jgi:nitric oxide reductase large subunit